MSDLKSCQHCKSTKVEIFEFSSAIGEGYQVLCKKCYAAGPFTSVPSTAKAAWNTRPLEREAYLAGWRAGREAAAIEVIESAKIFDTSVFIGPPHPSSVRKAQDVAAMIRTIPEPKEER